MVHGFFPQNSDGSSGVGGGCGGGGDGGGGGVVIVNCMNHVCSLSAY